MSIVRLNGSHFALSDLELVLDRLKRLPVRIMLDLPGQESRISGFDDDTSMASGYSFKISDRQSLFRTDFRDWHSLKPGMRALLQDGALEAVVVSVQEDEAELQLTRGGVLRPHAHLYFPDLSSINPALSDKDLLLIDFAMAHELDQIALSHVRHPDTVRRAREIIEAAATLRKPELVVKFETKEALEQLDEFIALSDIILLGRGDLSNVVPVWDIPLVQRRLAQACTIHGKPLYIATQILSSLAHSKTPSRADVSDIVFALLDGAAGITLTDETVLSEAPGHAIRWCKSIIDGLRESSSSQKDFEAAKNDAFMTRYEKTISQLATIGTLIWQRGWAEANAGNVSIRLTEYGDGELTPVTYLVSRTGSRYRQLADDPMKSLLLIEAHGNEWHSLMPNAKPTSEWTAHLGLHQLFRSGGSKDRVILHSHPAAVIAISHHPIFRDEQKFNAALAEVLPELPLYLKQGVCCCPAQAPGSIELAKASVSFLKGRKAMIWEKHGLLCFGQTLDEAFDYMEIVVKAVEIWLRLREQTPSLS